MQVQDSELIRGMMHAIRIIKCRTFLKCSADMELVQITYSQNPKQICLYILYILMILCNYLKLNKHKTVGLCHIS